MKHCIIIIGLIFLIGKASNGQDSNDLFFDEFTISLNRTILQDDNTEDRYGFGLGAYRSFRADKKLNIVFGLEYNRTSQFKKSMYASRFAQATDLTYRIHCFSIPFGFRLNVGAKSKFFMDAGGFADLVIRSKQSGTMHTHRPDENNQMKYTRTEFDGNAGLSDYVGLYAGLGVRIPISRVELVVKPDYKFGINNLYSYRDEIFNRYFRINIGIKINYQQSRNKTLDGLQD